MRRGLVRRWFSLNEQKKKKEKKKKMSQLSNVKPHRINFTTKRNPLEGNGTSYPLGRKLLKLK